jgi:formiminotetrahydrofolate cyclodeaminase
LTNTLIIVEGHTDKAFIEGITEKLQKPCKIHPMRGNKPEKVILKDLHRGEQQTAKLIDEIKREIKQLQNLQHKIHTIIVKRSVESWILAGLCVNNPEETPNPEEELKKLMQKTGKHYIKSPEVYKRLAKEVDLEKQSKSLRHLKSL